MHSDDSSSLPTPTDSSYSSPFQPRKFILSFSPCFENKHAKKMTMNLNLKKNKAQGTHTHTKPTNIQLEP